MARRAFAERWIDVYENPGKHSGAYSAAVYGVHMGGSPAVVIDIGGGYVMDD